jgi:nucleoside-diphosphate-sugar epimerase
MGASKRSAELLVQSLQFLPENKTKFITTRFGNVLGSNGSVIPLFKKQIEAGGPDCEEATKNGYIDASDAQIRTYEAKHYFYPIPTTQLTLNKNMKQNPGW